MWSFIFQGVANWLSIFCTILAFVIPFSVYKINRRLHAYGDPPWKRPEDEEQE